MSRKTAAQSRALAALHVPKEHQPETRGEAGRLIRDLLHPYNRLRLPTPYQWFMEQQRTGYFMTQPEEEQERVLELLSA